jgi:esterase FrsA
MATLTFTRDRPRTLDEAKEWLRDHLRDRSNPFVHADPLAAAAAIERLSGLDGESWGACWGDAAAEFERKAEEADRRGDPQAAFENRFKAYALYFVGRYPSPNHPAKQRCYDKARENYLKAAAQFDPPLERVTLPFEGKQLVFYVRKPKSAARLPVMVIWGGIDSWKEETYDTGNALLEAGMAVVAVDGPGVGESPVVGSQPDAERQYTPVFEWVRAQSALDGSRIGIMGMSFGGYWATKVAHTHRQYLTCAVNWGGAVHLTFQPEWFTQTRFPEYYLMEFHETRARSLGGSTYEDYARLAPQLSLVDSGILEQPSAPMLLINGKDDRLTTIEDLYLLMQYGPKTARVFPGGHMGRTPQTLPTIVNWLKQQLRPEGA